MSDVNDLMYEYETMHNEKTAALQNRLANAQGVVSVIEKEMEEMKMKQSKLVTVKKELGMK